jgi:pectinesterase
MRILFFCIFILKVAHSQSSAGITNQIDSSYSSYKALIDTKKSHPEISLVVEFKDLNINEKREIIYKNNSNRPLQLDAFWPKKSIQKTPAIIIIHGGGWRTGNRKQHIPMAQKLASLGYATFTVEYRLSTEALYPAAVKDVKSAIIWVKKNAKKFGIDTSKVAALGFSAGGQLAALVGASNGHVLFEEKVEKATSSVHAIVDLDGILAFIHPESGEGDDTKRTSAATYWFGFSKTENPDLWKQGSALTYVSQNTPPTLFINSSVERMHAGRADYIAVLNENKIYSEVKTFENSPHSFPLFNPWFNPMIETIDRFLKKVFE